MNPPENSAVDDGPAGPSAAPAPTSAAPAPTRATSTAPPAPAGYGSHAVHDTAPAGRWEDAHLSGNGEYGIMVNGGPHRERVVLNHHRYVLPNGTRHLRAPETAHRLEEIRDLVLAGRAPEAQRIWADGAELRWTQSFHPGHALEIATPAHGPVRDYLRSTDFATGEITVGWQDDAGPWRRRSFVSRSDAVVVQEFTGPPAELRLRLTGDLPDCPEDVQHRCTATEAAPGLGLLDARATYPPGQGAYGFEAVTLVHAPGARIDTDGDVLILRGARRVLLLTALDRQEQPGWSTGTIRRRLGRLPADYDTLLSAHTALHTPAYRRATLDLGAGGAAARSADLIERQHKHPERLDPALLELLFHSGRYLLLSASGVLPPRLTGLWIGGWGAAWAGDFTTDANLNLQLAGANLAALPEAVHAHAALVRGQIADWRANARALYGIRGLLAPGRTDGEHGHLFHLDDDWPWPAWLAGADWLLHPLHEYWRTTGDDDFLRAELAGWLIGAAEFFEDFLTRVDDRGQVVFVPSYSPEIAPEGVAGSATVNAVMDVAAGRHALESAVEVCEHLGIEPAAVARWRALLPRLPAYLVNSAGSLTEWAWPGLDGNLDHRHVSHLYPVWPLHEITPDTTPALAEAARRALAGRGDENLSAHGSLHRALAAARLRDAGLARANLLKILGADMLFRSLMTSHNPGLEIYNADAAIALPGLVLELLVDARPGRLDLLPALPEELARGTVRGVACQGRVTVLELDWDLAAGTVRALLRSAVDQVLAVHCRGAGQEITLPAGGEREVRFVLRAP
ncbi:glycosyl hydrolase family 95 catalytic domain-containing protein [Kitasatospora herbaricolor]|uniref:Glycoside hydrolase family 95 protein n=1 Tax=Kitasatospora herbaricolor TaxID=68217 RepID=A0ABZ1W5E6_9ACTN|nr:glycoside hydrolase N-terminal domain-containing protein [Kitasatospora herbaricolor]